MPTKRGGRIVQNRESLLLVIFSLLSLGITYATSIVVARTLGPGGFERYAVAVATLTLLSTMAEPGVGKLSIQMLPGYEWAKQSDLAAGYWRYSIGLVLLVSIVLGLGIVAVDLIADREVDHHSLLMAAAFLPGLALAGVSIDFVMANRNPIHGAIIARIIVPACTLTLVFVVAFLHTSFSPALAVGCFGMGSVIGTILAAGVYCRKAAPEIFSIKPAYDRRFWFRECLTFLALTTLVSWIFKISLIILEALPVSSMELASFAAALETGCMILLISKSTDKYFQPSLSVMIEREAWEQGEIVRRRRWIFVGSVCLILMILVILLGKQILKLYGESFASGYPHLCLIAAGSCAWTLFSLSSSYLKSSGLNRLVLMVAASAAVLMACLTYGLGYYWGTIGGAMAFCVVLIGTSLAFRLLTIRQYRRASLASQLASINPPSP